MMLMIFKYYMHYFFANSYLQLYHALDFDFNNEQKVTIITSNIAIEKFCRHVSKKVIFYNLTPKYATFKVHKELKHLIKIKSALLPHIKELSGFFNFSEVIPVSALGGHNLDYLEKVVKKYLPEGPFLFPKDQFTDRSLRFFASELIREKITRQLGDELPYEITVEIEKFVEQEELIDIHGLILVDKKGQKKIIIGKNGDRLKSIGSSARQDMEKAFESKVMLRLWVKVKNGWADDDRALQSLGYMD